MMKMEKARLRVAVQWLYLPISVTVLGSLDKPQRREGWRKNLTMFIAILVALPITITITITVVLHTQPWTQLPRFPQLVPHARPTMIRPLVYTSSVGTYTLMDCGKTNQLIKLPGGHFGLRQHLMRLSMIQPLLGELHSVKHAQHCLHLVWKHWHYVEASRLL